MKVRRWRFATCSARGAAAVGLALIFFPAVTLHGKHAYACAHYNEALHVLNLMQVRRLQYTTVLRVRPDHIFLHVMPPVTPSGWLGAPLADGRVLRPNGALNLPLNCNQLTHYLLCSRRVLLWDDQMALARRADAATALLSPSVGYGLCADEAQWRRALRAGGHGDLALITPYTVLVGTASLSLPRHIPSLPLPLTSVHNRLNRHHCHRHCHPQASFLRRRGPWADAARREMSLAPQWRLPSPSLAGLSAGARCR